MKTIVLEIAAARSLRKLPEEVRTALDDAVVAYALGTTSSRVKALVGIEGIRIRVGNYRIIAEETADEIIIVAVGDRRDIYR